MSKKRKHKKFEEKSRIEQPFEKAQKDVPMPQTATRKSGKK